MIFNLLVLKYIVHAIFIDDNVTIWLGRHIGDLVVRVRDSDGGQLVDVIWDMSMNIRSKNNKMHELCKRKEWRIKMCIFGISK